MVVTTDMLHTKTDFLPGMTDWQCGWMAAAVTLSDMAAKGAAPSYLLLAVGLDRRNASARSWKGRRPAATGTAPNHRGGHRQPR